MAWFHCFLAGRQPNDGRQANHVQANSVNKKKKELQEQVKQLQAQLEILSLVNQHLQAENLALQGLHSKDATSHDPYMGLNTDTSDDVKVYVTQAQAYSPKRVNDDHHINVINHAPAVRVHCGKPSSVERPAACDEQRHDAVLYNDTAYECEANADHAAQPVNFKSWTGGRVAIPNGLRVMSYTNGTTALQTTTLDHRHLEALGMINQTDLGTVAVQVYEKLAKRADFRDSVNKVIAWQEAVATADAAVKPSIDENDEVVDEQAHDGSTPWTAHQHNDSPTSNSSQQAQSKAALRHAVRNTALGLDANMAAPATVARSRSLQRFASGDLIQGVHYQPLRGACITPSAHAMVASALPTDDVLKFPGTSVQDMLGTRVSTSRGTKMPISF